MTAVGSAGRSRRPDGSRNGAHGAGEGSAAVAVVAELAEAGRARRQQDNPARPGPPVPRRYRRLQVRAAGGPRRRRPGSARPGRRWLVRLQQPGSRRAARLRRRASALTANIDRVRSRDPGKDAKLDRIEHVTSHYPHRRFAFRPVRAVIHPALPRPVPGAAHTSRPAARHPSRSHHGIRCSHGPLLPRAAAPPAMTSHRQPRGVIREHHERRSHLGRAHAGPRRPARQLPGCPPSAGTLPANKTPPIRRQAVRENAELRFTPVNASRASPGRDPGHSAPLSRPARIIPVTPYRHASSRPTHAGPHAVRYASYLTRIDSESSGATSSWLILSGVD